MDEANKLLEEDLEYCNQQIKEATVMVQSSHSPYSQIAIDTWTNYKERWERIKNSLNETKSPKLRTDFGYRMTRCQTMIPRSAKVEPVWIRIDAYTGATHEEYEIAYLTDDEEYFVSIDHKRVYPVAPDILWTKIPMPYEYCK